MSDTTETDGDLSQIARWRTWKLLLAAVATSVGAGALKAVGEYLIIKRDQSLHETVNDAIWFTVYMTLFWLATLLWVRRQARRGRHTWFTESDDRA
jgi:hypothetical protein